MARIVVKVGSNVLTRSDGTLDVTRVSSLVDQTVKLREKGFEVILVTSGVIPIVNENDTVSITGPMGLAELTTYKWLINGYGQTRQG